MKRIMVFAALVALPAVACDKSDKKQAEQTRPVVAPESVPVLAQVELPAGKGLGAGDEVLDTLSPGMAAQAGAQMPGLLAQIAQVPGLDGADLDRPVRLVVLDPEKHDKPVVLAVAVADAAKLAETVGKEQVDVRGELALIGERGAVDAARDYVLGTLATRQPERPRAVVFTKPVLARFGPQVQAFKAQMGAMMAMSGQGEQMAKILPLYVDMLVSVVEQSETLALTLTSQSTFAGAEVVLQPRADTTLAAFTEAQAPADFALLRKLPQGQDTFMLMAAHLVAGPAHESFMTLGTQIMEMFFAGAAGEEMAAIIEPWMDLFEGDFAVWAPVPEAGGMDMVQLFTVSDGAKAAEYSRRFGQAVAENEGGLEVMGMKQTITFEPEAFVHDGVAVAVQHTKTETEGLDPQQQAAIEAMGSTEMDSYLAGFDSYMGMTMGAPERMKALIDAARGKAPGFAVQGGLARALEMAREREDSLVMLADLGAMLASAGAMPEEAPSTLAMTLGFAGGAPKLFIGARR